jgi:hypothetical protein
MIYEVDVPLGTDYVYPALKPLEFWEPNRIPRGRVSFTDRKYHSLDVKLNPSKLPDQGYSPLHTLYPDRPYSVYDDIDTSRIVPSHPKEAKAMYDQKTKQDVAAAKLLQEMTLVQGDQKHKVDMHPAVEPDVFTEDPTLGFTTLVNQAVDDISVQEKPIPSANQKVVDNVVIERFGPDGTGSDPSHAKDDAGDYTWIICFFIIFVLLGYIVYLTTLD